MITRIVKMEFNLERYIEFEEIFEEVKHLIRGFEGNQGLKLYQDANESATYFTYSFWDSEEHLNAYRNSELFTITWKKTKALFRSKPEAWTLTEKEKLI